jgi:transcription initiation factor IIE alpha subunit
MNDIVHIPCPDCQTKITVQTSALISGVSFQCPNCDVSIGLAAESVNLVKESFQKLKDIKEKHEKNDQV